MKNFLLISLLLLTACSGRNRNKGIYYSPRNSYYTNLSIDKGSYSSKHYNDRVRFIIIHYTAANSASSIKTLVEDKVSIHYLITTAKGDPTFQLLPDNLRAWHAGLSEYQDYKNLNDNSIGIEIVNLGYQEIDGKLVFTPFKEHQIIKLANLLYKLIEKYDIGPTEIIGHSDISPDRKSDPGPLFPWEILYKKYNIGAWYDNDRYQYHLDNNTYKETSIIEIQTLFKQFGYPIRVNGQWDEYNKKVVRAFQMHFRPSDYSGNMDLESYAILLALIEKYKL